VEVGEFVKSIGKNSPASVCLFTSHRGPRAREATFEPLLAQRAVDKLVETYVDPSMRDMCYNSFLADDVNVAELVSIAETLPFLTERRVIVLHNAEKLESESAGKALHLYLENPCETTLLLMIAPRIDRRLKLFKLCEKHGQIIECPELKGDAAIAWARTEIASRNKKFVGNAATLLVARSGTRLSDIRNAIEIVCNYVGEEPVIQEVDVIAACADVAEDEVWSLTDAIANSDTGLALEKLRALLELGKNEFEILGTVNWMLKSAYFVASGNTAKMAPFVAKKHGALAEKLGKPKFRDAFALCTKADVMFRTTGVDRALALELLVLKLAAPRPQPRKS